MLGSTNTHPSWPQWFRQSSRVCSLTSSVKMLQEMPEERTEPNNKISFLIFISFNRWMKWKQMEKRTELQVAEIKVWSDQEGEDQEREHWRNSTFRCFVCLSLTIHLKCRFLDRGKKPKCRCSATSQEHQHMNESNNLQKQFLRQVS